MTVREMSSIACRDRSGAWHSTSSASVLGAAPRLHSRAANVAVAYSQRPCIRSIKMQAMPELRQQSFEEIYGPPENFLEIEVVHLRPDPGTERELLI